MTDTELLALRTVLADQRRALLSRLQIGEAGIIEPGFLRRLADLHTTIAAVDAALAEFATGDAS